MSLAPEVKVLAKPLFDEGAKYVYVVECCGRVFVGRHAPVKCGTCSTAPMQVLVIEHSALDNG